ncbi:hypothetical protein [Cellulophaga baltica]|uniref:Uncharacterized protein n=1 Tax=Cellulophaga baltica 18 TaxID=1348584 RepID=A0AAU8RG99_9FLAO|nr:hypothetical protein [Cellulophaga baltica]AIZ42455.1 hypothetical protein M666_13240 [Cellulophaga baltica 18]WFO17120.1 hypothetical protein M601_005125 [Cellulophaga baltica 4]
MKKAIYILIFLVTLVHSSYGQKLPIPDNYSVVDSVSGDLDKDSIAELVVAYNTGPENEIDGIPRELIVYKLKNNKWTEWKKSGQALYGSKDGGMMGDPFGEIEIKNGILLISQNGGSSWKWGFTDKYRFQNGEFYLIGYSSIAGKLCEYWKDVDFNLSTGKMIIKKEYEECETEEQEIYKRENETLFENGLKITIQNRQEREIKITTPKYGYEIYIAVGKK